MLTIPRVSHTIARKSNIVSRSSRHVRCVSAVNVKKVKEVRRCVWENVEMGPPDPILGVTVAFQKDSNPNKINLGVGAYRDDNGKPFILECVKKAEKHIFEGNYNHEYGPIGGLPDFVKVSQELLFGADSPALKEGRVASIQTLSGTGALRVAGEFLYKFTGQQEIYVPDPTWANHIPIFQNSGFAVNKYKYYDGKGGLDFEGLKKETQSAASGSIFLLHACAHNPTGVDPTPEQWEELGQIFKSKKHLALFDCAYQGFASGDPTKDSYAVRHFVNIGVSSVVTQSYAKNFGLYGERVGNFHIVTENTTQRDNVLSQLLITVRPMYSNPPIHGARIVGHILSDPQLTALWEIEVKAMADRIIQMRSLLVHYLTLAGSTRNWSHITQQIGMFCYSGLSSEEVSELKSKWSVYMTSNGRISMAGVTSKNCKYLADAMYDVTRMDGGSVKQKVDE